MLTVNQLSTIYEISPDKAGSWIAAINEAMKYASINTAKRAAAFLSQIGHESGRLKYSKEIWGPTTQQLRYEGTTLAKRLGNTEVGDGLRYRGRGLLQITGRYNYRIIYQELKKDFPEVPNFEEYPAELETKKWASLSAARYWNKHNLNVLADSGDFITLTKKINGGTNGLQDRQDLFLMGIAVLS